MSANNFYAKALTFNPTVRDTDDPDTQLFYLPLAWVSVPDPEFQNQVIAKLADVVMSAFGDLENVEVPLGRMITELLFTRTRPDVVSRSVPVAGVLYDIDMWYDSVVMVLKVRLVGVPQAGLAVRSFVVREPVVEYTDSPHIIKVRFPEGWAVVTDRVERNRVVEELASVMVAEFGAGSLRTTFQEMVAELLFGGSGWLGWQKAKPDIVARPTGNTNIKVDRGSSVLRVRVTNYKAVNFVPRDDKAEVGKIVASVLANLVERHPELKATRELQEGSAVNPESDVVLPVPSEFSDEEATVVVTEELTKAQLAQVTVRKHAVQLTKAVDNVFSYIQRLSLNKLTLEQEFELERLGVACRTVQGLLVDLGKVEDAEVKADSLVTAEKVLGRIQSSVKVLEKDLSDDVLRELKILERYVDMRDNGALLEE